MLKYCVKTNKCLMHFSRVQSFHRVNHIQTKYFPRSNSNSNSYYFNNNVKDEIRQCVQYGYCPNSESCVDNNKCERQESNEYD